MGGNIPIARAAHSSAVVGKRLYVFGGMSETGALNDLYVLNTGRFWLQKIFML